MTGTGRKSFYVVSEKAVPEVLRKVMEAKRLLDSGKVPSVQEATEAVGISRSSFYKYKEDIFPYHANERGKMLTMVVQLVDEPGLLSVILATIARYRANILTIHQSIPVDGVASLSLSIDVYSGEDSVQEMIGAIESVDGIFYAKIL